MKAKHCYLTFVWPLLPKSNNPLQLFSINSIGVIQFLSTWRIWVKYIRVHWFVRMTSFCKWGSATSQCHPNLFFLNLPVFFSFAMQISSNSPHRRLNGVQQPALMQLGRHSLQNWVKLPAWARNQGSATTFRADVTSQPFNMVLQPAMGRC